MESASSPFISFWHRFWADNTPSVPTGGKDPNPEEPWVRLCTKPSWEVDILIEWLQGYEIMTRRQDIGIEAYLGGGASTVIWVKQTQFEEAKQILHQDTNTVSG